MSGDVLRRSVVLTGGVETRAEGGKKSIDSDSPPEQHLESALELKFSPTTTRTMAWSSVRIDEEPPTMMEEHADRDGSPSPGTSGHRPSSPRSSERTSRSDRGGSGGPPHYLEGETTRTSWMIQHWANAYARHTPNARHIPNVMEGVHLQRRADAVSTTNPPNGPEKTQPVPRPAKVVPMGDAAHENRMRPGNGDGVGRDSFCCLRPMLHRPNVRPPVRFPGTTLADGAGEVRRIFYRNGRPAGTAARSSSPPGSPSRTRRAFRTDIITTIRQSIYQQMAHSSTPSPVHEKPNPTKRPKFPGLRVRLQSYK